jgi:hypothetical protein
MSVKGLERAIQNLNSLSRLIVPEATAALNRVASRTISQGKAVAKEATVDDNRKRGFRFVWSASVPVCARPVTIARSRR